MESKLYSLLVKHDISHEKALLIAGEFVQLIIQEFEKPRYNTAEHSQNNYVVLREAKNILFLNNHDKIASIKAFRNWARKKYHLFNESDYYSWKDETISIKTAKDIIEKVSKLNNS